MHDSSDITTPATKAIEFIGRAMQHLQSVRSGMDSGQYAKIEADSRLAIADLERALKATRILDQRLQRMKGIDE